MANDYNTCYYSAGDKHKTCTHSNYCIFNKYTIFLEKNILYLEKQVIEKINDLKFIIEEGGDNSKDYLESEKALKLLQYDLNEQYEFKQKIINNKGDNTYGYVEIW